MTLKFKGTTAWLLSAATLSICTPTLAHASATIAGASAIVECTPRTAVPLAIGSLKSVRANQAYTFSVNLKAGDGILVDLTNVASSEESSDSERRIRLCNANGENIPPSALDVFPKGGSVSTTDDGERVNFVAQTAGTYLIAVAPSAVVREILARPRDGSASAQEVRPSQIGKREVGSVSSNSPVTYSFQGRAGEWVELKSVSDKDTLLRLAGPDLTGEYSVIAENDDSDELNPVIRRRLPTTGLYYVQVDSFASEAGSFTLTINRTTAPPPPPAPIPLGVGSNTTGRLTEDAKHVYVLPIQEGRSYRLELTAAYDSIIAIGLNNPVEANTGENETFLEIDSKDANLTGTERLDFTARQNGQILVRVGSFGIANTNGSYTLIAKVLSQ